MTTYSVTRTVVTLFSAIAITACSNLQSPAGPSPFDESGASGPFSLRGRVMDAAAPDGAGVSGLEATLALGSAQRQTATDGEGAFTFDGLAAGDWTLTLSLDGVIQRTDSVHIDGDVEYTWMLDRSIPVPAGRRAPTVRRIK